MSEIRNLKIHDGNINLKVRVVEIEPVRTLESRTSNDVLLKQSLLVTDKKNPSVRDFMTLTLWEKYTTMFALGDEIELKNAYVSVWNETLYLTIGKYGDAIKIKEKITDKDLLKLKKAE